MFKEIFLFELKLWFKRPAAYIFFGVFFLIAVLYMIAQAGLLGNTGNDTNTTVNSAFAIAGWISKMNTGFVGLMILITVIAPAVYKDFQYNVHPLIFTKPITKFGYMMGRFSASFLVSLFVVSGGIFGHLLMCSVLGGDESHKFGPVHLMNYIEPFVFYVIPNTLLLGALFFSFVTFSRNMIAGYVGVIALVIIKGITSSLLANLDNQQLGAILEPFGEQAFRYVTKFWTPEEQNTLSLPFEGVILINRILWFSIGMLIVGITYARFRFSQFNEPVALFKRKGSKMLSLASAPLQSLSQLPKVTQDFSVKFSWYQVWFLAKFEFSKIVKSIFFFIIVALSVVSLLAVFTQGSQIYGTKTYPVTYQVLELGGVLFRFFMNILIIFYAGVMVWRERDGKVEELIGTAPIRLHVIFLSKFIGLSMVQAVLLLVTMVTGICMQIYSGYFHLEIGQYLIDLFGFRLIGLMIICAFALSLQTIFDNRYVGYIVTAALLALPIVYQLMEWNIPMIEFNSDGGTLPYSDMNGFGHTVFPYFVHKLYWSAFVFVLSMLAVLMWVRGKEKGFMNRWKIAKNNMTGRIKVALIAGILLFGLTGAFIYYNTSVLNKNISSTAEEKGQAEFEKKYKKYSHTQQPRVVEANWNVDIFPDKLGAKMKGYYIIKNKSTRRIDSIVLNSYPTIKVNAFRFEKNASMVLEDKDNGFYIYKLSSPLMPGDSMRFDMDLEYESRGFKASPATGILENGSFFNSGILPNFGYNADGELSEDVTRKKYGLPKKDRMAKVNDSAALQNTYISADADWIRFECVVSTVPDQIALAPGYLQKEWTENDRRYFHYKMDCKILNFYAFLSARYEVKKDVWTSLGQQPVNIEIYYHKGHEYNLDAMIKGVKKSLDYYTKNFSPYQHHQVRILEFPRYATFAQSFPNTIPFSEGIGFIAQMDKKDPESIDYPFYVTAHEVAHQWWAHQVIGGNVQGATLMSETMSQYSALMVMEKEFGKKAMKKFLKYEMNNYLRSRAFENKKELPLALVENQQYIHYNKGSIIMYALKDYIGEDSLNAALAKYIKKVAYQEPPYTNSTEFLKYIKAATPDSLKYIITDMFETITIYENKTTGCSYTKLPNGKYKVKISIESKKFRADSLGKSKETPESDWIDIGVFGSKEENGKKVETELYLAKHKIDKNKMDFEIIVDELPEKAGIDPYNKLVDRTPDNNTRSMSDKGPVKDGDEPGGVTITVGGK
ncbi:MAG: M1 family aminopeptidase [Bacteroidia bacterium]